MADVLVTPAFQSPAPDSGDATKLGPSAWNAARLFSGGAEGDLAVRLAASATGAAWRAPAAIGLVLTDDARLSDARVPLAHTHGLADLAPAGVAAGSVLVSGGVGAAPVWSASPTLTALTVSNIAGASLQVSSSSGFLTLTAPSSGVILAPGNTLVFANGSIVINGNAYGLFFGSASDLSLSRDAADTLAIRRSTNAQRLNLGQGNAALAAGRLAMGRDAAAAFAPGAGYGMLRWETGTNAGTLKLVAYSGTSTTGVTVADNVGGGS